MSMVLPNATREALITAFGALVDSGAGAGTGEFQLPAGTEVATVTFSDPAFASYTNGVGTFDTVTGDASATGNAAAVTKFVIKNSTGTVIATLSVGLEGSGEDVEISNTTIGAGEGVDITSGTVTMPAS